ncbi:hypothetical protein M422DRAFT_238761 [Sphaerobolus stellatus SS14]|nr:hypothetical protein M422DRAFT_238761 [Sphaerobolus stellatus SS14]
MGPRPHHPYRTRWPAGQPPPFRHAASSAQPPPFHPPLYWLVKHYRRSRMKHVLRSPTAVWFMLGFGVACLINMHESSGPPYGEKFRDKWKKKLQAMEGEGGGVHGKDSCMARMAWLCEKDRERRRSISIDPFSWTAQPRSP